MFTQLKESHVSEGAGNGCMCFEIYIIAVIKGNSIIPLGNKVLQESELAGKNMESRLSTQVRK